jgi:hypothetical protein
MTTGITNQLACNDVLVWWLDVYADLFLSERYPFVILLFFLQENSRLVHVACVCSTFDQVD